MEKSYLTGKGFVLTVLLAWALLVALSLTYNLRLLDRHVEEMARQQAEGIFGLIKTARTWNAMHKKVYVPPLRTKPAQRSRRARVCKPPHPRRCHHGRRLCHR